MCVLRGNTVDVLISLFQFISRPHPATLTLKSIPSFMVHHLQSILPSSLVHDGLPRTGHMFAEFHRSFLPACLCVAPQWEVPSRCLPSSSSFPRLAALLPCFPTSSSSFHHPARLMTGSSAALTHDNQSAPPTPKWETGLQNKGKWPFASLPFMVCTPSWNFCRAY